MSASDNFNREMEQLSFTHFPAFARFLLEHKLDALVKKQLELSRELKIPLLKWLKEMPEEQLFELSKTDMREMLSSASQNNLDKQIKISLKKWKKNLLSFMTSEQVVADDITLVSLMRKRTFLHFIPEFTQDMDLALSLIEEIDRYIQVSEAAMFETFVIHNIAEIKESAIQLSELNKALEQANENLRRSEEAFEQKNKELEHSNKELSSFSYVASHDLQEPLRKIMMFSQMLADREHNNLSEKGREMFGKIQAGAISMKRLIEDLLAFSRLQSYNQSIEEVNLNDIVAEIKNANLDLHPDSGLVIKSQTLPSVKGISFQLYQLLENIIGNAIKYAKPNVPPKIDIMSEIVIGKAIHHEGAEPNTAYHKITITDNGIGFEQQYAEKIFEIFQRLHKKQEYIGTGIGLAICKKIVQNHKGFIEAKGVPDVGAAFTVYLPV